ncbi:MAG: hypothetical protein P1R74_00760 [Sedimenticola sp.]|nr:hypothetical protein [Sedimenticola sp.]
MKHLKLIPDDEIREIEETHGTNPGLQEHNKQKKQEVFLAAYEQSLSLKLACERAGVHVTTFRYWKKTDADFCRQLNAVLADWQQELVGAAANKALGYTKIDPVTDQLEVDGSGKVIRYNQDSAMLKYFLERMDPDLKGNSGGVEVVINMAGIMSGVARMGTALLAPSVVVIGDDPDE